MVEEQQPAQQQQQMIQVGELEPTFATDEERRAANKAFDKEQH